MKTNDPLYGSEKLLSSDVCLSVYLFFGPFVVNTEQNYQQCESNQPPSRLAGNYLALKRSRVWNTQFFGWFRTLQRLRCTSRSLVQGASHPGNGLGCPHDARVTTWAGDDTGTRQRTAIKHKILQQFITCTTDLKGQTRWHLIQEIRISQTFLWPMIKDDGT